MQEIVNKIVNYLCDNFSEEFYIDYEEKDDKKTIFIQFVLDKIVNIDTMIEFFYKINKSKSMFCEKQELEIWKTKNDEPIIQINYIL